MFTEFLTLEGERLLAKAIEGSIKLTFTKMEVGDGDYGTSDRNLSKLQHKVLTVEIYNVHLTGDNVIEVTSILKSEIITDSFYFREKGIYASDGTNEYLMIYGTSGSLAEYLIGGNNVFERTLRSMICLSASDNINIELQSAIYASEEIVRETSTEVIEKVNDTQDAVLKAFDEKILEVRSMLEEADWATFDQATRILTIMELLDTSISSRAPANTALINSVWTDARAALLDRLGYVDTSMSSRAPADTALNKNVWTDSRAGALDGILNGTYGLPALRNIMINGSLIAQAVKRVIHGTARTDENYTISPACNPSKTIILLFGSSYVLRSAGTQSYATLPTYDLTETYLRVWLSSDRDADYERVGFELIEFY